MVEIAGLLYWLGALLPIYAVYKFTEPEMVQTEADLACHVYIAGVTGSGKTRLIFWWILQRIKRLGQALIATKDVSQLLPYIQLGDVNRVLLMRPYAPRPRGLNLFARYTNEPQERELIASQTVDLFKKLYSSFGDNMEELTYHGALAILEYSDATGQPVNLWDLYTFFQDDSYQSEVLHHVKHQTTRDAFAKAEARSVAATLRRLRKPAGNDFLLATLCQDDIDLEAVVRERLLLICDFDEGHLGESVANFLAQLVISKLQLVCNKRKGTERLFVIYADEFQDYLCEALTRGVFKLRSKKVSLHLSHQSRSAQFDTETQAAVLNCGSHYLFQTDPKDEKMARTIMGEAYKEFSFSRQPARRYVSRVRYGGFSRIEQGRTVDMPPEAHNEPEIERNNSRGPTREEIVSKVQARKVERDPIGGDLDSTEVIHDVGITDPIGGDSVVDRPGPANNRVHRAVQDRHQGPNNLIVLPQRSGRKRLQPPHEGDRR